jgi:hypothetical protein
VAVVDQYIQALKYIAALEELGVVVAVVQKLVL